MLKLAECRRLMYSIGNVLSILPLNKTMEYLNVILAPSYEDLQKLTQAEPVSTYDKHKMIVIYCFFFLVSKCNKLNSHQIANIGIIV